MNGSLFAFFVEGGMLHSSTQSKLDSASLSPVKRACICQVVQLPFVFSSLLAERIWSRYSLRTSEHWSLSFWTALVPEVTFLRQSFKPGTKPKCSQGSRDHKMFEPGQKNYLEDRREGKDARLCTLFLWTSEGTRKPLQTSSQWLQPNSWACFLHPITFVIIILQRLGKGTWDWIDRGRMLQCAQSTTPIHWIEDMEGVWVEEY